MYKSSTIKALILWTCMAGITLVRMEASPRPSAAKPADASSVSIDPDDIGGVVTSSKGPEAGVWVIAETTGLPTKFRKMVVTNDNGQYLLPDLPKANYNIWVRGYGLVDSKPVEAAPGVNLALTAVVAPTPRDAAEYFPASYWVSLLKIPTKSEFPMNVPTPPPVPGPEDHGNPTHGYGVVPTPKVINNQAEWLFSLKGCWTCHQVGLKKTREIPASMGLKNTPEGWERFMMSGQVGRGMITQLNRLGHDKGLAMYADWGDRIAKGEVPVTPPRPQGVERNVVVSVWDWAVPASFLHALISTDKRNPTVNANGPVYGAEWQAGALAVTDPVKNTSSMVSISLPEGVDRDKLVLTSPQFQIYPSLFFGEQLMWHDPVNPGPITMDERGRVWFNVENRIGVAKFCGYDSTNPFAKHSPRDYGAKGVDVYDPKTNKFDFVDLCFKATRIMFSDDKDNTLYFTVQVDGGIGWLNVKKWEQTHDAENSQGWCPAVIDYNGDGKIGPFTKGDEPPDPSLDREIKKPGAYGIAYNPVDGSVWYSSVMTVPGRLFRMVKGDNPPSTCLTEMYEAPYDAKGNGPGGSHTRGIDIDTNGVVWTPLTGEGNLASFDRRKCKTKPTGESAWTGQQCREGWSFYPIPGPKFKSDPTVQADYNYYMWVDRYNTLGLGNNAVIVDGANSDSLIIYLQDKKEWVRMTVPYPMGFFSRFLDGRIDNPNGGWKGRGVWAGNQLRGSQLTEGKNMPSQVAHFQIRPDPLAK